MVSSVIDHPAKFSPGIIIEIESVLHRHLPDGGTVLDPFAGSGLIHHFHPEYETIGIELEPEWATQHERTRTGDATKLPFDGETIDAVVTSPCYGNRMADTYRGQRDTCTRCGGDGLDHGPHWMSVPCSQCFGADHPVRDCPHGQPQQLDVTPCPRCIGTGLKPSRRYTYAVYLGHDPSEGSAASMQWGDAYRLLHERAWAEAWRVLRPGGLLVLNISDHVRQFRMMPVSLWHATTLATLGFQYQEAAGIPTRRMMHGQNRELRPDVEWLITFRK